MHSTGSIPRRWSIADSRETYAIHKWGGPYFDIGDSGNIIAYPGNGSGESSHGIDLKELVDEVRERGIGLPLLIRFPEILSRGSPNQTKLSAAPSRSTATKASTAASIRSRSTKTASSSNRSSSTGGLSTTDSKPAASQSFSPSSDARGRRGAHHLQRLQRRGIRRKRAAREQAGPQHHPGGRKVFRAAADCDHCAPKQHPSADRHPRQAGDARFGTLGSIGRRPQQVRSVEP